MDSGDGFVLGLFVATLSILLCWIAYITWQSIKENERKELADEIFKRCYNTFELKKRGGEK